MNSQLKRLLMRCNQVWSKVNHFTTFVQPAWIKERKLHCNLMVTFFIVQFAKPISLCKMLLL